jgi:hypothetical protein
MSDHKNGSLTGFGVRLEGAPCHWRILARQLHEIDMEDVLAIGDGPNDIRWRSGPTWQWDSVPGSLSRSRYPRTVPLHVVRGQLVKNLRGHDRTYRQTGLRVA